MSEKLDNKAVIEAGEKIFEWTKKSLSLLEKETWISFFNRASKWLKDIFWFKDNKWAVGHDSKESDNNLTAYTNVHIPEKNVKKAWDYITNWWTFYSPSKWNITWGWNKYKHVCSTWSYAVLEQLWIENKSKSNECDLKGKILPKMGLEYIWDVNPDNPEENWYKPQNWDTAVRPKFNGTQHQATFINWHWVSDTIQRKMSCYSAKNEPMVKVYRYTWNSVA